MRVIFLDVDGVLNSGDWLYNEMRGKIRHCDEMVDPAKVALLNELVERSGAVIVVSSSWRLPYEPHDLQGLIRLLKDRHGIKGEIIGMTPDLFRLGFVDRARGHEIDAWIEDWDWDGRPPIESFVILDDDSDMAHLWPCLVKTDFQKGLQPEHVEAALEVFRREEAENTLIRQKMDQFRKEISTK